MNNDCVICLKSIRTSNSLTRLSNYFKTYCECNYYYHSRCINAWVNRKSTCPICRSSLHNNIFTKYIDFRKVHNIFVMTVFYISTVIMLVALSEMLNSIHVMYGIVFNLIFFGFILKYRHILRWIFLNYEL